MNRPNKVVVVFGKIIYLMSVILPLIDAVRGIKRGLQTAKDDLHNANQFELWKKSNEIKENKTWKD